VTGSDLVTEGAVADIDAGTGPGRAPEAAAAAADVGGDVGDDRRIEPGARFAHASEAEMARILDFYAVAWEYEPTTFPILWNLDGAVVESFAPDFYLPDFDVFLEMTTLKQRLVRKKNRKLRRLRTLYPDVRIKLFYARDFRAMMLKYGRLGLAESLSGTPGQVVPERPGSGPATTDADVPASGAEAVEPPGVGGDQGGYGATRARLGRRRRAAARAAGNTAERAGGAAEREAGA